MKPGKVSVVRFNAELALPTDIHGVPGTGKTATVHSVVRELQNDTVSSGIQIHSLENLHLILFVPIF